MTRTYADKRGVMYLDQTDDLLIQTQSRAGFSKIIKGGIPAESM